MSYDVVLKRRPPGVLLLLCTSLWSGICFGIGSELIERQMIMYLERTALGGGPNLVTYYWLVVVISGVGQGLVVWFLLRGHYWARVVMLVIVGFAGLAFVRGTPIRMFLVMQQFQMAFEGWPDVLLSGVGMAGLHSNRTDSFWSMIYNGMKLGHMVATLVCLFLPHVRSYCMPLIPGASGQRRVVRSLY